MRYLIEILYNVLLKRLVLGNHVKREVYKERQNVGHESRLPKKKSTSTLTELPSLCTLVIGRTSGSGEIMHKLICRSGGPLDPL